MLKSSLIEIIRTFTKQELAKFEDFVRSPFFNKKENVVKLFLEIKKYAPSLTDASLEKEKIWDKVFPGKEYNYGIMKNLIFDLNKLAEEFITTLRYNADKYKKSEYLLNSLLDRELNKIYVNKYNSLDMKPDLNLIDTNNLAIVDHLNFVSEINNIKLFYHHKFDQNYRLEELQITRDSYGISAFLISLFEAYNDVVVNSYNRNSELDNNPVSKFLELISPGLENFIESIKEIAQEDWLYVKVYFLMHLSIKERSEEKYLDFKNIIFENIEIFPKTGKQALHYCLITAITKAKLVNLNIHREIIEIFDSLAAHNLITDLRNDYIPIHIFNTYISNCFLISDIEKIKSFSDRFINKLEAEFVESTKNYVKFLISFINKDFQEALNHISQLDIPYAGHKISVKYQRAMCIYEIQDYEMFLNDFDNLKHFIKNNKFITSRENNALTKYFLYLKRLFNLRQNFDQYEFTLLKNNISDTYKGSVLWFNEKLDEIEKTNSRKLKVKSLHALEG